LKFIETFSDKYGTEDLKIATQLESVLSCSAEEAPPPLYVTCTKTMLRGTVAQQNPAIFGKR